MPAKDTDPAPVKKNGRQPNWKKKLAAALFGLSIGLLIGEIGFRVIGYSPAYVNLLSASHEYDPELGFIGRKNFVGQFHNPEFSFKLEYTADGFRKIDSSPADASKNLYLLGDSFAWGWGVKNGNTIGDLISQEYKDCAVKNFALPGYGTLQQYLVFERFIRPNLKSSDAVIIFHYGNDFDDNLGKNLGNVPSAVCTATGNIEIVSPPQPDWTKELKNYIKKKSYLCNFIAYTVDYLKYSSRMKQALKEREEMAAESVNSSESEALAETDARVKIMRTYLSKIKAACDAENVPLLMVRIPFRDEYQEGSAAEAVEHAASQGYRPTIAQITGDLGIPCFDLHHSFKDRKSDDTERLTFQKDFHWNNHGHQLAFTSIRSFLSDHIKAGNQVARKSDEATPAAR